MSSGSKWIRLHKQGIGAFNAEIWQDQLTGKLWLKVYVYNTRLELSGDFEVLKHKMNEFAMLWNELADVLDTIERHQKP